MIDRDAPPLVELERDAAARFPHAGDAGDELVVARDPRVGREVAIKRLAGEVTPEAVARFVREARTQGRLEHPSVVPVLDAGLDGDGRPYFVMRRVRGTSLEEVLARRAAGDREADRRWPLRRLLAAFADACLAIEHAHTHGVVHRALSPGRILLGDFGEVYVDDWSHADEADEPDAIDGRGDVFALGCVLFEILCLRPLHDPADAATGLDGAEVHAAARAAGRAGPPELLDAIAAAVAPPGARLARPRLLADAVRRWLDGVRDLARRRELAARHRERARAALAAGDRAAAIREAGSAVALLPDDAAATELLGRLVLEPPDEGSAEAAAVIAASDAAELRGQARIAALSYLAVPLLLPALAWPGIERFGVLVAIAALGLLQAALAALAARGRLDRGWVWISTLGNVVMLGLYTRIFGPVHGVPAMAATLAMAAVGLPAVRPWWGIAALLALGVLGPWALEAAGVLAPTTWATGASVVVASDVVALPRGPTLAVMAIHTVALVFIATNYVRQLTRTNRDARRRLLSQAWHLEQIASPER